MPEEAEPNFEQALAQLERIVANLERGEPELTAALAKYEKGVQLLSLCHRLLDQAEQSVAILTGVDELGKPVTAPFDATATIAREATSPVVEATDPAASELKPKSLGRPTVRRSRSTPADETFDADDPPF